MLNPSKKEDTPDAAAEPFQEMEKAEPVPIFDEPALSDSDIAAESSQELEKAGSVPIFNQSEELPLKKQDTVDGTPLQQNGIIIYQGKQYPIDRVYIAKDRDDCIIFKVYVNKK